MSFLSHMAVNVQEIPIVLIPKKTEYTDNEYMIDYSTAERWSLDELQKFGPIYLYQPNVEPSPEGGQVKTEKDIKKKKETYYTTQRQYHTVEQQPFLLVSNDNRKFNCENISCSDFAFFIDCKDYYEMHLVDSAFQLSEKPLKTPKPLPSLIDDSSSLSSSYSSSLEFLEEEEQKDKTVTNEKIVDNIMPLIKKEEIINFFQDVGLVSYSQIENRFKSKLQSEAQKIHFKNILKEICVIKKRCASKDGKEISYLGLKENLRNSSEIRPEDIDAILYRLHHQQNDQIIGNQSSIIVDLQILKEFKWDKTLILEKKVLATLFHLSKQIPVDHNLYGITQELISSLKQIVNQEPSKVQTTKATKKNQTKKSIEKK